MCGGLGLCATVARTLDDYVALAVAAARRPAALRRLRRRLLARRQHPGPARPVPRGGPLGRGVFDVPGWMRAYEAGLRLALETRLLRGDDSDDSDDSEVGSRGKGRRRRRRPSFPSPAAGAAGAAADDSGRRYHVIVSL